MRQAVRSRRWAMVVGGLGWVILLLALADATVGYRADWDLLVSLVGVALVFFGYLISRQAVRKWARQGSGR